MLAGEKKRQRKVIPVTSFRFKKRGEIEL